MAQLHKIELQTQIKSPPEKFFDIYKNKSHLMPKICPNKLQSIQVAQGDGKSVGSVRLWTYVMGKLCILIYAPLFLISSIVLNIKFWIYFKNEIFVQVVFR